MLSDDERNRRVELWLKKWAEAAEDRRKAREREENTAGEVKDDECVPDVADGCNRFALDLVGEVDSVPSPLIPSCVDGLVRLREMELEEEGGWPALENPVVKKIDISVGEVKYLGSSGDEDEIIGGVIVAGGALQKAKNAARKRKRKIRRGEASGRSGGR